MKGRECLNCGFIEVSGGDICRKCDAVLLEQTDGSWAKIDIAHDQETVQQAAEKLEAAVKKHMAGYTRYLRVVIGRGKIQTAIWPHLSRLLKAGKIKSFEEEPQNPGALVVTLRD